MFDLKKASGVVWAGDLESFHAALRIEAMCIEGMKGSAYGEAQNAAAAATSKPPRMYASSNGVAIINIRGPLINAETDMTAYFGVSTYPAIREALVYAANDPAVSQVILDIESGGGSVAGCNDCATLIANVNRLKPVTTFTGGLCCSAAYWLGSSGDAMYADQTAIVGSVGVITTHVSYADALKADGLQVTVIRAGDNKMLGHPAEPLSDKARAQIQGQMNTVYDIFTGVISANTGLPMSKRDAWANGNVFLGVDAVDVGLITDVSTADKVYSQVAVAVDKAKSKNNTRFNN